MGLLDDAIREHLDLKRRRGADPTEIERAEREALGPVRRGPETGGEDAPPPEPALEPEAGVPSAPAEEWDPFYDDHDLHEDAGLHEDAERHEPAPTLEEHEELPPHPADEPIAREPQSGAPPFEAEADPAPPPHPANAAPAPEPATGIEPHSADSAPPAVSEDREQETEEYELESEAEQGHDVLESTPEFLQDAPDHDRLWFEQRPPRDFDFDG
jgi:hypothetical protein